MTRWEACFRPAMVTAIGIFGVLGAMGAKSDTWVIVWTIVAAAGAVCVKLGGIEWQLVKKDSSRALNAAEESRSR